MPDPVIPYATFLEHRRRRQLAIAELTGRPVEHADPAVSAHPAGQFENETPDDTLRRNAAAVLAPPQPGH